MDTQKNRQTYTTNLLEYINGPLSDDKFFYGD